MVENSATIVAIELLAACQGVDFRKPLHTSPSLQNVLNLVRGIADFYVEDRVFQHDIEGVKDRVVMSDCLASEFLEFGF